MDEIERIFAPALADDAGEKVTAQAEAGVVNASLPSVAQEGGATDEAVRTVSMCALADFVMRQMRVNYDARNAGKVDERLRYCIQSQTCTYTDEQKQLLRDVGINERVYSPLTATKVRAVHSMLMELSQYDSDVPFEIRPTSDPDVPAEVEREALEEMRLELMTLFADLERRGVTHLSPEDMERLRMLVVQISDTQFDRVANAKDAYAKQRAQRLQRKVWDKMEQGGYEKARRRCLEDFCIYGTAVMVGPTIRNVARNASVKGENGVRKVKRVVEAIPYFERISPVDCYPAPYAEEITDGALCVRVRYVRDELWRYRKASAKSRRGRGEDGWRDSAIAKLLADRKDGVRLNEFPADRAIEDAEKKGGDENRSCKYEGVRCFAYVDGSKLLELGITKSMDGIVIQADAFYYTETVVVANQVLFCRIYDDRMGAPLHKSVFYGVPGSWWGEAIADKLYSVQTSMNNAIVSLLRNMGPASSAMMWMKDVSRLSDKSTSGTQAEPGKIFAFTSPYPGQSGHDTGVPMGVLQIPSNAQELLRVAEWATKQSDIDSGIPAFSEGVGGSNGGALRTAEGLRTYTEHSTRGVKAIGRNYDDGIGCGPAKMMADWILIYDDDTEIKGDVEVKPVGLMGKILRAQNDQLRLQIFNICLNNKFMQGVLGVKGILALFRPSLKDIGINPDDVIPTQERVEMLEEVDRIAQLAQAVGGQQQVSEAVAESEGGEAAGMPSGVAPVASGVAERRGAA